MSAATSLPKEWMETTFGQVVSNISINEKKLPRGQYSTAGKYPVVDQGQLFIGGYTDDEKKVISDGLPLLVFGDHTRIFKLLDQPFVPGADGIKVLKPLGVDPRWLYQIAHALEFPDKGYARHFQHLKASKLLVPPLPEQQRIVAEIEKQFTRLEAGVTALRRVQANLKRYRAAILKAACEGKLVPTEAELHRQGKTAEFETGEELLNRILAERQKNWTGRGKYKEPATPDTTNLPALPEGWTWATVEQLSTIVQYGSSAKTTENNAGIPVLRMGNIEQGKLVFQKLKYLPATHDEFPELLLQKGDLLFNRTNSAELVGKTAVFRGTPEPCSFASYLIRIKPCRNCLPDLIAFYINSVFGRAWIAGCVSQQVGQANVNGTKLQALAIPLPPFAEQTRIVAEVERRLSKMEDADSAVSANLQRAARLRLSILQKAFTGNI